MSRKSLLYLRFREMFLSVASVADGAFNVLQQGSQDWVTPAAVGVREDTSDLWVLVAGVGRVRFDKLLFFGPELPAPQSTQLSQPQFRGFSRFVQKFDIAAVGTDGSLTLGGVTPEGVLQTSVRLVDTGSAVDL